MSTIIAAVMIFCSACSSIWNGIVVQARGDAWGERKFKRKHGISPDEVLTNHASAQKNLRKVEEELAARHPGPQVQADHHHPILRGRYQVPGEIRGNAVRLRTT